MNALRGMFRIQQVRELSLLFIFALVLILFSTQINNYFSARTFNRISGVVRPDYSGGCRSNAGRSHAQC